MKSSRYGYNKRSLGSSSAAGKGLSGQTSLSSYPKRTPTQPWRGKHVPSFQLHVLAAAITLSRGSRWNFMLLSCSTTPLSCGNCYHTPLHTAFMELRYWTYHRFRMGFVSGISSLFVVIHAGRIILFHVDFLVVSHAGVYCWWKLPRCIITQGASCFSWVPVDHARRVLTPLVSSALPGPNGSTWIYTVLFLLCLLLLADGSVAPAISHPRPDTDSEMICVKQISALIRCCRFSTVF